MEKGQATKANHANTFKTFGHKLAAHVSLAKSSNKAKPQIHVSMHLSQGGGQCQERGEKKELSTTEQLFFSSEI